MEFYKSIWRRAESFHFKEFNASSDPSEDNNIMHAVLDSGSGIVFMASDTPKRMEYRQGASITMSLTGEDDAELTGYFSKLSAGGTVSQPLEKAPWGARLGMCTDKFGIAWFVNIIAKKA